LRCGMVQIGDNVIESTIGRVTIVNWDNLIVLDSYVKVSVPVIDYHTEDTGITHGDLEQPGAVTFEQARSKVANLIKDKILIGHGLEVDLSALGLTHPWSDLRDTANYAPYMFEHFDDDTATIMLLQRELPSLVAEFLNRETAYGPGEEAVCILDLYKVSRNKWEKELMTLVRQKERQRQMVLSMRSGKRGTVDPRSFVSICKNDEYHRFHRKAPAEAPTLLSSTVSLTKTYSDKGDDLSDTSTFVTTSDQGTASLALPPGLLSSVFDTQSSEIENLREVLGVAIREESFNVDSGIFTNSVSLLEDSGSAGRSHNLWGPTPLVGSFPGGSAVTEHAQSLEPLAHPLTEEELLGHLPSSLVADLNDYVSVDTENHKKHSWLRRIGSTQNRSLEC
jgi:hypothetical protein